MNAAAATTTTNYDIHSPSIPPISLPMTPRPRGMESLQSTAQTNRLQLRAENEKKRRKRRSPSAIRRPILWRWRRSLDSFQKRMVSRWNLPGIMLPLTSSLISSLTFGGIARTSSGRWLQGLAQMTPTSSCIGGIPFSRAFTFHSVISSACRTTVHLKA